MLASGMTTDMSDVSATQTWIAQDASTTSVVNSASTTQAAAGVQGGVATTTKDSIKTSNVKVNPNKAVESKVREYFSDVPIMAEVAKCESRYRQFEPDGSIFRGIVNDQDVGAMQVNEYYHAKRAKKLGLDLRTLDGNMAYARLLYNEQGTQPWNSSAPCWMKSDVAKALYDKKLAEK